MRGERTGRSAFTHAQVLERGGDTGEVQVMTVTSHANLLTMRPIIPMNVPFDIPMNVPFTFCNKQPLDRSLSEPWAFFRRTQPEELGVHAMLLRPMGQVQCR